MTYSINHAPPESVSVASQLRSILDGTLGDRRYFGNFLTTSIVVVTPLLKDVRKVKLEE